MAGRIPHGTPLPKYHTYAPGYTGPLTRGDVLALGPNQHTAYTTGLGYYAAPGAPATPAAPVRVPARKKPAVTVGSDPWSQFLAMIGGGPGSSWGAVQKQAQMSVNDQIKLALADQQKAYDQARLQGEQQALGAKNAQQAVIDATAGDAAGLQGAYQQAADRERSLGQGLAGDVLASENANVDASNAAIQRLGAPGGPIAGYDTAALNNAALMRNVVNPGKSLEDQAAGAYQLGQGLRSAQIGTANQGVLDQYGKLADLRKSYLSSVADLEAKRPTLLSQALTDAQNAWRQNMALYASALGSMGTAGNYASEDAARKAAAATAAKNAATARARLTGRDPVTGNILPGWKWDPKTKSVIPRAKAGGGAASTPAGQAKAVQQAVTSASVRIEKVIKGAPFVTLTNGFEVKNLGRPPIYKPLLPYRTARQKLLAYFPAIYQKNPRVLEIVNSYLEGVGYKIPKGQ